MTDYPREHADRIRDFVRQNSVHLRRLRRRNSFFHSQVNRLVAAQVQAGSKVIDLGCSDGKLLQTLSGRLQAGAGVDIDPEAVDEARDRLPDVLLECAAVEELNEAPLPFPDYIVMSMILDQVYDVYTVLQRVHSWSQPDTRIIVVSYNRLWRPLLRLAELLRLKAENPAESYIPRAEVKNLLESCKFEITKELDGVLVPVRIPVIARLLNRWIAPLPFFRHFGLVHVTVARPLQVKRREDTSISIIIAARNEEGHIDELLERIPRIAARQEVIFVEGGSRDNTWAAIQKHVSAQDTTDGQRIIALKQTGTGKGDAVRTGFAAASGDVLMILDADISVPPEELPRFFEVLQDDTCEFANGSRLMYPMEERAMRFLNMLGNKFFGVLFTYLLGQPVRDTLCGTKVLRRESYERLAANRSLFGDFDPFGDFDLLFGAAAMGLRIRDVPVHYKERRYGETNISRFRHGVLLLRMSRIAAQRLKFVG